MAVRQHQAGRFVEAEQLYRGILAADPKHLGAQQYLGILGLQTGRPALAVERFNAVLALDDRMPECHHNLALALRMLDRLDDAVRHYRRAIDLAPHHVEAHVNLANALAQQSKLDEAVAIYRRALALDPSMVVAHSNLAGALLAQGRAEEAMIHFRRSLALDPSNAAASRSIGNILASQGRFDEAAAELQRALALDGSSPEGHDALGSALAALGKLDEAIPRFERAVALERDFIVAYSHLALAFFSRGQVDAALGVLRQAIDIGSAPETRHLFIEFLGSLHPLPDVDDLRELMARAFSESWCRASHVAAIATPLIRMAPSLRAIAERAAAAWPKRLSASELLGTDGLAAVAGHRLLGLHLTSAPVCDVTLERFLTALRAIVLELAGAESPSMPTNEMVLDFCCALARQCFLNEYVFAIDDAERAEACRLRDMLADALASGTRVPDLWIAAVASYFPLGSLPMASSLMERAWSDALTALLVQQVREPNEERGLRASIPALTAIEDDTSQLVRQQYEQNPYPRWGNLGRPISPQTVDQHLRAIYPLAPFRPLGKTNVDILIAGCGSGQHPIEVAQLFPQARVLAIDLSLSSLAYAKRKTRELGIDRIEYAQADILGLPAVGRSFDVIEACGVLHHLAEPVAGWRALLSLLRPGGVMKVGLYSELARAHIKAARVFIAERGFRPTVDDIRSCRQELMALADGTSAKRVAEWIDFFTTSECRDLIFHVQEHRFTLPRISAFLEETGLVFVGFDLGAGPRTKYRARFPADAAMTNLDCWHIFETENPDTFRAMYNFWVQSGADRPP